MQKKRKKINITVLLKRCVLCGLVLYLCGLFITQQFDFSRLSKENKVLDKKITEEQRVHEELLQQKEAAGTPEYIERVARDKLGYMKPDEKVFIDAKKQ
ncbi:MAG: septum formation initiator family protein [Ruminococcaceae bacterium]|nr:septum formation initiator family protein [Oscillospiraceae bacterium]